MGFNRADPSARAAAAGGHLCGTVRSGREGRPFAGTTSWTTGGGISRPQDLGSPRGGLRWQSRQTPWWLRPYRAAQDLRLRGLGSPVLALRGAKTIAITAALRGNIQILATPEFGSLQRLLRCWPPRGQGDRERAGRQCPWSRAGGWRGGLCGFLHEGEAVLRSWTPDRSAALGELAGASTSAAGGARLADRRATAAAIRT